MRGYSGRNEAEMPFPLRTLMLYDCFDTVFGCEIVVR
jgi:hypothetical protein